MIKNVIFDLGRVLIRYDMDNFLATQGYSKEQSEFIKKHVFDAPIWCELDRGTYTFEQGRNIISGYCPDLTEDLPNIMGRAWMDSLQPIENMVAFYLKLREEGYKTYLLSNFSEEGFNYVDRKFPFLKECEGRLLSYQVNLIKPELEIYKHMLEMFSLIPEETVFIDDMRPNIEAAAQLGIKTILFTTLEETITAFNVLIG